MIGDLRNIIELLIIGNLDEISLLGFYSNRNKWKILERIQLENQRGPKKRISLEYKIGEDSIWVTTKYLKDKIVAQHVELRKPIGEKNLSYIFLNESKYGVLKDGLTKTKVHPQVAIEKILSETTLYQPV